MGTGTCGAIPHWGESVDTETATSQQQGWQLTRIALSAESMCPSTTCIPLSVRAALWLHPLHKHTHAQVADI
ncbi:hypothetical protein LSAT2_032238 [Lamellibrachia satsuma]|nr:hypothetical protein LSAT2_032238 [Lamellibrachia satsuma]